MLPRCDDEILLGGMVGYMAASSRQKKDLDRTRPVNICRSFTDVGYKGLTKYLATFRSTIELHTKCKLCTLTDQGLGRSIVTDALAVLEHPSGSAIIVEPGFSREARGLSMFSPDGIR